MNQSKTGRGALIIAVIALGAAYVSLSMFMQTPVDNSASTPQLQVLNAPARSGAAPGNSYIDDLLTPGNALNGAKYHVGERFAQILATKTSLLQAAGKKPGLSQSFQSFQSSQSTDLAKIKQEIADALEKGDTASGLAAVKKGLDYCRQHQQVAPQSNIDILLDGARLSHKAMDFDLSRLYISQATILARQNGDYKLDDIEALHCILNGQREELIAFNADMAAFTDKLSLSQYKALPPLADHLLAQTKFLPEDSYLRLQAAMCKAVSLVWNGADSTVTGEWIDKVEKQALAVHDQTIVGQCQDLRVTLQKRSVKPSS